MSDPHDQNGEWPPSGQAPQQPYGQTPDYGQPASYGQPPFGQSPSPYGQQPQYGQPAPFDQSNQSNPFDQSQGLNSAPTTPYGQQAAYGQQPQYGQTPDYGQSGTGGYGAPSPYGQPDQGGYGGQGGYGQGGFGGQGFYPQPTPQKKNTGKIVAGIGAAVVVIAVIAAVALHGGGNNPSTPIGSSTVSQSPLATSTPGDVTTTAPDSVTTTDDSDSGGSTTYTKGECVTLTGDEDDLDVEVVSCSEKNDGQINEIVSSGTTGDPTADAPLCLPYKYDDNDFEETGDGDGTGVLYCLSATNGEHDLRYATTGSCIYRPSGDDVVTYVVDCSNKLANYVALGVLTNTTSDSKCDKYSNDEENFFSPDGESPTYVVCAKEK